MIVLLNEKSFSEGTYKGLNKTAGDFLRKERNSIADSIMDSRKDLFESNGWKSAGSKTKAKLASNLRKTAAPGIKYTKALENGLKKGSSVKSAVAVAEKCLPPSTPPSVAQKAKKTVSQVAQKAAGLFKKFVKK